jgi:hypothetical protein
LVPNPSFEEYNNCPGLNYHVDTLFSTLKYWYRSTDIDGIYFNKCATNPIASIPHNRLGYSNTHTGNGYTCLMLYNSFPLDFGSLSYLSVNLTTPLQKILYIIYHCLFH